jgi:peroxiredoxin
MTPIKPGMVLPDFELPDQDGALRRLSELQDGNPMVLMLGRGEHCPRERQHQREMIRLHGWCAVAFTSLVTIVPNDLHDVFRLRASTGAYWPYLADEQLEVQEALGIREYPDPHHPANVPHTLVVAPGLVVDKVYVGYWFWGRPSPEDLWGDLRDLFARVKDDYDPLTAEARASWEHAQAAAV